jgi:hypothetical protein
MKYMVVEMIVQIANYFDLFLDYLGKNSIFDCEQTRNSGNIALLNGGFDAHPEWNSRYNLKDDATKTPNIDDPRILVSFHLGEHLLVVFELVLEEDVVEDFRRHVLGSGHGELLEVGKEETAAEVDELHSSDVAAPRTLLPLHPEQDVLSLEVGVHNVVAVDQQ